MNESDSRTCCALLFTLFRVSSPLSETFRIQKQKKLRNPFGSRSLVRRLDLGQLVLAGLIELTFVKGIALTAQYDGGALATGISALHSAGSSTPRRLDAAFGQKAAVSWWWRTDSDPQPPLRSAAGAGRA